MTQTTSIQQAIENHLAYRNRHGFTTESNWSEQYGDFYVIRDANLTPVELVTTGDDRAYVLALAEDPDYVNLYSYIPGLFDHVIDGSRLA